MTVSPSKKMMRRLFGVIVAQNGYISSGANDSLLRWVFEKASLRGYKHDRIADIEALLEALENERDIVLSRDSRGKIVRAELTENFDISHADLEIELFTTPVQLWTLVTILRGRIAKLQQHPNETEAAIELALEAEHQRDEALRLLTLAEAKLATRTDTSDLERQIEELGPELERVRAENATLTRRVAYQQEMVLELKAAEVTARKRWGQNLSSWGSKYAACERKLETTENVLVNQLKAIRLLMQLCRDNNVGFDQLKTLNASFDTI